MSEMSELLSIIASVMSILGIGGVFTWSLFKRRTQIVQDEAALPATDPYYLKTSMAKASFIKCAKLFFVAILLFIGDVLLYRYLTDQPLLSWLSVLVAGPLAIFQFIKACYYWIFR